MDMIGNTPDAMAFAARGSGDGGEIGMECRTNVWTEPGVTVLRAEDQVKDHLGKRLWHVEAIDESGFQPLG